jgi:hypothetical protein
LGGFAAAVDGVRVPDRAWRLKKARELVKLLALAPGHRLHREQVMDVLWRDRGPAAAANNLHQAVYVARMSMSTGWRWPLPMHVVWGHRLRTAPRSRCMAASCCLRTVTTTGPRSDGTSWLSWPRSLRMAPPLVPPTPPVRPRCLQMQARS